MTEMLLFMGAPFVACVILLLLCGYLGQHVLEREIIFIDIAMAQIAALGSTLALVLDHGHESFTALLLSLLAVALASGLFAFTRYGCRVLPLEAVIGVTYAVSAMAALLLFDQAAGGHDHMHDMLAGSILWVSWEEVGHTAIVFALVGLLHLLLRKQFKQLSNDYEKARVDGKKVRLWDFLFYLSFGTAMVFAVQIAGILMVFAFLIIPASISAIISTNWLSRIVIAWAMGMVVCLAGLILSWNYDLQCGPTLVCLLGCALTVVILLRRFISPSKYS
jgi:zinc/manganese transport system permease protein